MYYETKTLLLGGTEKICDFSIDDYILERIDVKDINYIEDNYFSLYGEKYCEQMYPYYQDIVCGKYYILLTHITYGERDSEDNIYYSSLNDFQKKPFAYRQGCINVLKFIKKIQLIAGINVFPAHILTTKTEDDGTETIEFNYPFQIPSYRVLRETFQFPASKLELCNFIFEINLELPQGIDKGTLAFEFFIDSLYQQDIKMEYLMLIMALETLLGDETTRFNTLSKNYANFMATDEDSKKRLDKDIGLLYWTRNQLMHKGKWNAEFGVSNTNNLREFLRLALLKYIEEIYGIMQHEDFIKMLK